MVAVGGSVRRPGGGSAGGGRRAAGGGRRAAGGGRRRRAPSTPRPLSHLRRRLLPRVAVALRLHGVVPGGRARGGGARRGRAARMPGCGVCRGQRAGAPTPHMARALPPPRRHLYASYFGPSPPQQLRMAPIAAGRLARWRSAARRASALRWRRGRVALAPRGGGPRRSRAGGGAARLRLAPAEGAQGPRAREGGADVCGGEGFGEEVGVGRKPAGSALSSRPHTPASRPGSPRCVTIWELWCSSSLRDPQSPHWRPPAHPRRRPGAIPPPPAPARGPPPRARTRSRSGATGANPLPPPAQPPRGPRGPRRHGRRGAYGGGEAVARAGPVAAVGGSGRQGRGRAPNAQPRRRRRAAAVRRAPRQLATSAARRTRSSEPPLVPTTPPAPPRPPPTVDLGLPQQRVRAQPPRRGRRARVGGHLPRPARGVQDDRGVRPPAVARLPARLQLLGPVGPRGVGPGGGAFPTRPGGGSSGGGGHRAPAEACRRTRTPTRLLP
jgi:hypothetical protein